MMYEDIANDWFHFNFLKPIFGALEHTVGPTAKRDLRRENCAEMASVNNRYNGSTRGFQNGLYLVVLTVPRNIFD